MVRYVSQKTLFLSRNKAKVKDEKTFSSKSEKKEIKKKV